MQKSILLLSFIVSFILIRQAKAQNSKENIDFINNEFYTSNLYEKAKAAYAEELPLILSEWQEKERAAVNGKMIAVVPNRPSMRRKKLSLEEVYKTTLPSVYMVGRIFNSAWDTLPHAELIATAFAINSSGTFITNYHVLRPVLSPSISAMTRKVNIDSSLFFLMDKAGKIYFMDSLLAYDQTKDIALFQVKNKGVSFSPISIGNNAVPGTAVYCLAHPDNNFFYFSEGIVNQNYIENIPHSTQKRYIMSISTPYAVGASGGPLLDSYGNLVGMVSFTRAIYSGYNQQGQQQMILKQAVPVSEIKKLIK